MGHVFVHQRAEDFLGQWFTALEKLTPQESTNLLAQTTVAHFTQTLKVSLSAEEFRRLTAKQIEEAHEAMCDRLFVKAAGGRA